MAERYKVELGQAIKRRRESKGWTQGDLAKATHYKDGQAVSRWERGANMPSNLDAVAEALDCTLAELVEGIIPPNKTVARKLGIVTANGTPDLAETFNRNDEQDQFAAIMRKLDRILALLDPAGEEERDVADALAPTADIPESPQPPADDAQQIPPAARRRKSASS